MKFQLIFIFLFCLGLGGFSLPSFGTSLPEQKAVEVLIVGRMGNQMFQYAVAHLYAQKHHKKLYVLGDLSGLERVFGLNVTYAVNDNSPEVLQKRANAKVKNFDFYDESFEKDDSYELIVGYSQDVRFFNNHEDEIRELFTFKEPLNDENQHLINQMNATNSVSVHIRRGDYVGKKEFHFLIPQIYYERAMEYIAERIPNPHFYIFSDDIKDVQKNMRFKYPHTFVQNNEVVPAEDMRLMSACKHNIIANSSFSWWGAWLNTNPDKIVITPNVWLADGGDVYRKILPPQWVRLPAMSRVAILSVVPKSSLGFWDDFYRSMEKSFLPQAAKTYFVWTDERVKAFPLNVVKIFQEKLEERDNPLTPIHLLEAQKEQLKDFDYVYYFDVVAQAGNKIVPYEKKQISTVLQEDLQKEAIHESEIIMPDKNNPEYKHTKSLRSVQEKIDILFYPLLWVFFSVF